MMFRGNKYIEEFITKDGFLIDLSLFPTPKELTESMGMCNAIKIAQLPLNETYNCIIVGDGYTPRTGALVAMKSNYECYSIDPNIRLKERWNSIKRLSVYDQKIETMYFSMDYHTILLLLNSKTTLKKCLECIKCPSLTIITKDCRYDSNDIKIKPDIEYRDKHILNEKNVIKIWKCYKKF